MIELGKRGPRQSAAELRAREAGETAIGALGMRLGEGTGAALGIGLLRAALACYREMATFEEGQKAIQMLNGRVFKDRSLIVNEECASSTGAAPLFNRSSRIAFSLSDNFSR